jgi:Ca-activated chloride channel family protein
MLAVRTLVLGGALAAVLTADPFAQQAVYRKGTVVVPVYVTATDVEGRPVPDLTRDDFVILDNGVPQPLVIFNAGALPISIVVMLDMSGSMADNISRVRAAAVQLFTRLLPEDRARVGAIAGKVTISPTFTNNVDDLTRAMWIDLQPGDGTPLWGGLNEAMSALTKSTGRRVILVLTDGYDTGYWAPGGTNATFTTVTRRVQTEDVMVYSIGMEGKGTLTIRQGTWKRPVQASLPPAGGIRMLAYSSGGRYFELRPDDELGTTFAQVADELHRQYELGFRPSLLDGKEHHLEVRVLKPGVNVRARQSYLAAADRER